MIIILHIKGENNQNSFNLTLPDNVILKRNQDGTSTLTIGDVCATKPDMEVENLTAIAPTTILENSHIGETTNPPNIKSTTEATNNIIDNNNAKGSFYLESATDFFVTSSKR